MFNRIGSCVLVGIVGISLLAGAPSEACADEETTKATAAAGDVAKGTALFAAQCAICHGDTGKGDGLGAVALDPKPRDLSDAAFLTELTDQYIVDLLKGGGAAVGKSPLMPPLGAAMTDEQLADLISFLRELPTATETAAESR